MNALQARKIADEQQKRLQDEQMKFLTNEIDRTSQRGNYATDKIRPEHPLFKKNIEWLRANNYRLCPCGNGVYKISW